MGKIVSINIHWTDSFYDQHESSGEHVRSANVRCNQIGKKKVIKNGSNSNYLHLSVYKLAPNKSAPTILLLKHFYGSNHGLRTPRK